MKSSQETAAIVEAAVEELAATLERAGSSSFRLSAKIRTMDAVAFQTNLLALNAAVEAAQPGQAQAGYVSAANRSPPQDLPPPVIDPPATAAMRVAVRQIHPLRGNVQPD